MSEGLEASKEEQIFDQLVQAVIDKNCVSIASAVGFVTREKKKAQPAIDLARRMFEQQKANKSPFPSSSTIQDIRVGLRLAFNKNDIGTQEIYTEALYQLAEDIFCAANDEMHNENSAPRQQEAPAQPDTHAPAAAIRRVAPYAYAQ